MASELKRIQMNGLQGTCRHIMLKSFIRPSKTLEQLETEKSDLLLQLQHAEQIIKDLQKTKASVQEQELAQLSLRRSEARLEIELSDAKLLQSISSHLIHEDHVDTLYTKIVEAAQIITQSDFASMQIYYPSSETETEFKGRLRLIATCGLSQEAKDFWEWVTVDSGATCAVALKTGKRFLTSDVLNCEYIVGKPDHPMFEKAGVLSAQTTPLFSRTGKLLGMISTHWKNHHIPSDRDLNLLDILARQGADLLERRASDEAVQRSKVALTNADRRKDEFLATLAHELRNPLSPIKNAVQLLQASPTGDNAQELLAMMDRQVSHLVRLIDDLLDVSRISQGKIDLRRQKITLQNAVFEAIETSSSTIENGAHTLSLDLPEAPIWLDADLTRIGQIVSNLLNNAAKYTPSGGQITVSAKTENGNAILAVSDNGVGIPADMLSTVFDLFTQVDRSLDRAQGGLGIGLALVKQLIQMHGGSINAKSAGINQGSTFTITLPLSTDSESAYTPLLEEPQTVQPSAGALRVLVVDDNAPAAQTIGWLLELEGHEPILAHNAAEALIAARENKPDAILLDIGLPDMNGYDLCRELRKDPQFKNTLIIAQTGWGQQRDRDLAQQAGFDHHLVKPLNTEQLTGLLAAEATIKYASQPNG